MLIVRLAKILMIAAVGAFAFMVTYDNIVDYGSNYEFVRHVLSMDTTFSGNALMDRAVTDARAWKAAYAAIIAAEGLTCVQSRKDQRRSDRARRNGGNPPLPCRPWQCGAQGKYALHVRRAVRDVDGRDPMVPLPPAG